MGIETPAAQFAARIDCSASEPDAALFVERLQQATIPALVPNIPASVTLQRAGDHMLPVIISDGDWGGSYVAAPHSAYILYPQAELDLVELGWLRFPARFLLGLADRVFKALRFNHAVQIDNWLLSTNLHGDWNGEGIADLRRELIARYPDHFMSMRSVDAWSNPALVANLRADGWLLLPSRQIWVVDDMDRDWASRNNVQNDRRKLARSGLIVEGLTHLSDSDAARIAELYRMLYVDKYSALNPQYSARWMQMALATGLFNLQVARDGNGRIMAAAGIVVRGGIATNPMLGYDMTKPQADGLYRIASYMFGEFARTHGLRVNGSAGAGHFKQQRGAHSEIEYTAFHAGHLPMWRRLPLAIAEAALHRLAVPVMKKRML